LSGAVPSTALGGAQELAAGIVRPLPARAVASALEAADDVEKRAA
jgi:hypothetical protein